MNIAVETTERIVERLLQNRETGLYFKNPSEWTEDRDQARRFEDLLTVFETCHDCDLKGVQLVLKDVSADFEMKLDLDSV